MGFFSDLKDDLATAVTELMPEEEAIRTGEEEVAIKTEEKIEEAVVEITEERVVEEPAAPVPEEEGFSLDKMLETIDAIDFEAAPEVKEAETEVSEAEALVEEATAKEEPVVEVKVEEPKAAPVKEEKSDKGVKRTMESTANRMISDETAIITGGMTITGDILSEGSLDVIGNVTGNIDILGKLNVTGNINGNSKASEIYADGAKITGEVVSEGSVKIGQSSVIIGNITATSAVIAGAVKGDIDVKGPVILDTSAIVMGDIKSKSVQINNGAVIEGKCSQCYAEVNPTSFFEEFKKNSK